MNSKLDNEMKTGPLSFGAPTCNADHPYQAKSDQFGRLPPGIAADGHIITYDSGYGGGTSSVSGGASGSIGGGLGGLGQVGGATTGVNPSWLQDRITAACEPSAINQAAIQTIGQHIDRRIASLQEQLKVMEGIRSQLASIGALDLPTQAMRDALY